MKRRQTFSTRDEKKIFISCFKMSTSMQTVQFLPKKYTATLKVVLSCLNVDFPVTKQTPEIGTSSKTMFKHVKNKIQQYTKNFKLKKQF